MMTRKFHDSVTYNLRPWRKVMMNKVNLMVRMGMTYSQISQVLDKSPTTIQRYHVGFGDNCLDYCESNMFGRKMYGRDPRSVMYLGSSVAI